MEVVMPIQEFHFDGKTSTPRMMSSSSSPKRFVGDPCEFHCHSSAAPASPAAVAAAAAAAAGGTRSLPAPIRKDEEDDDFVFDFSGHLDRNAPPPELTTADELFYKGKIRPLKYPLRRCSPAADHRVVAKDSDPFSASMAEATRDSRSRNRASSLSSRSRKGSRSLSPLRKQSNPSDPLPISCKGDEEISHINSKKWSFKDLLLFRSASEGRATGDRGKDRLRKYTAACLLAGAKKGGGGDESRNSSFRCASPHAAHYAANRAAAEEMKRKTALPYKENFLSWLRFAPALRGFGGWGIGEHHSGNRGKIMAATKSLPPLRDGN